VLKPNNYPIFRYFKKKAVKDGTKKSKDDEDSDAESITDAEFDQFLGIGTFLTTISNIELSVYFLTWS